jgi:hypothetical protein
VADPCSYEVRQYGSAFANHRLKSLWTLRTPSLRLVSTNLATQLYEQAAVEYVEDGTLHSLDGPISSWPNATTSPSGTICTWTTGSGAGLRTCELATTVHTTVPDPAPPLLTLADLTTTLKATYNTPVLSISWGTVQSTTAELVYLQPRPDYSQSALEQKRTFAGTNSFQLETTYYWPKPRGGLIPLSTPLLRFGETRISGLTSSPILLTNYYSQTYGAIAHNYLEDLVFEPRLEPHLPPPIREELQSANIKQICVFAAAGKVQRVFLIGFDEIPREIH